MIENRYPEWLQEDIDETVRWREIAGKEPTIHNVVQLKVQFDMLVNSLKVAVSDGILSPAEATEIREENSVY